MSQSMTTDEMAEKLAKFPKGKPVDVPAYLEDHGNPEAAAEWVEQNEAHRDNFKEAATSWKRNTRTKDGFEKYEAVLGNVEAYVEGWAKGELSSGPKPWEWKVSTIDGKYKEAKGDAKSLKDAQGAADKAAKRLNGKKAVGPADAAKWADAVALELAKLLPGGTTKSPTFSSRLTGVVAYGEPERYVSLLSGVGGSNRDLSWVEAVYYMPETYAKGHGFTTHPRPISGQHWDDKKYTPREAAQEIAKAVKSSSFAKAGGAVDDEERADAAEDRAEADQSKAQAERQEAEADREDGASKEAREDHIGLGDTVMWGRTKAMVVDVHGYPPRTVDLRWTDKGTPGGRDEVSGHKRKVPVSQVKKIASREASKAWRRGDTAIYMHKGYSSGNKPGVRVEIVGPDGSDWFNVKPLSGPKKGQTVSIEESELWTEQGFKKQYKGRKIEGSEDSTMGQHRRQRLTWDTEPKEAAIAPGGLYGFTKADQKDCEASIRKVQRRAAKVAKLAIKRDPRLGTFLVAHAKRARSIPANILVAAIQAQALKLASEDKEAATDKDAARGLYGFRAKTAMVGLNACSEIRAYAGEVSYGLHTRRAARHTHLTGFFKAHVKESKCQVSRVLLSSYPDRAKAASDVDWLAWDD
jgi:hypothetical protein